MSRNKKMTILTLSIALVLFIIAFGAWWYLFFGKPNPPLPRADVSIASSTAGAATFAPTVTPISTSTIEGAAGAANNSGENPMLAGEELTVDGATFNVELATTTLEQARGLSFRTSLGANDGMIFLFGSGGTQTFWMKDMNFALDMIWISGNTVVGFAQNVPAPAPDAQLWQLQIYSSPANTDKVLEVNPGTVAKYNMKVGDTVIIGPSK
jgi:uncharacterized membrane protein (UPF0127 family)